MRTFNIIYAINMNERETRSSETRSGRRVLMVLGKNIGEGWTGERIRRTRHHLSDHSRVSVLAAGVALREGLVDEVVFTVTNTAGFKPLSEEEAVESGDLNGIEKPVHWPVWEKQLR